MFRYEKGRRLEYAVKRRLEEAGYKVFRCAASRPCDLIAIEHRSLLLVECKAGHNPHASPERLKQLASLAEAVGAKIVLATRKDRKEIVFYEISENNVHMKERLTI